MTVNFYVKKAIIFNKTKAYKGHFDSTCNYLSTGPYYMGSEALKKEVNNKENLSGTLVTKIHFIYPSTEKQIVALKRGSQNRYIKGSVHIFDSTYTIYTPEEKDIRNKISVLVHELIDKYPENTKKILSQWK